ncbi:alpha/beta hydrolase family esterase [Elstera litoralis]|uniref:alpha/beta hydrolase family esterase n=1 Tax=Elstera litoralis TaxID=552518 RepID=UPI0018DDD561|nr:PHB depolymerase family esterase [Elstera litoralis]
MTPFLRMLVATAVLVAAGAAAAAGLNQPGDHRVSLRHGGLEREFLVHVPRTLAPGAAVPLVLALHGGGGDMEHMARDDRYGLITKSDQAGFIAVFPNGFSRLRSGKIATWNAGNCCGAARDRNIDDVGFLRAVIAQVAAQAPVDRSRVFAIGMSNGGMMAYRLACEASDLLRGIMAVAGTDNTQTCSPARPVPVLHIHARNDDRVLFNGGAGAASRDPDLMTDFISVPATVAKWQRLNRTNAAATPILSVPGAICERYAGSAPVQLCVTETGAHSWPGGTKRRGEEPSQAIRANDVMWAFFFGVVSAL